MRPTPRRRIYPSPANLWYPTDMNFERLLRIVGDEPAFETGPLLAGELHAISFKWRALHGLLWQVLTGLPPI